MSFIDPGMQDQDSRLLYRGRREKFKEGLSVPFLSLGISQEISQIYPWMHVKVPICQEPSILYFTGVNQSGVGLIFLPNGKEILFLPQRDKISEFWTGKKLVVGDDESESLSREITGFTEIFCIDDICEYLCNFLKDSGHDTLGYLLGQSVWIESLKKDVEKILQKSLKLYNLEEKHYEQRCILDKSDLFCATKSNQITKDAFLQLLSKLHNLDNEKEVVSLVEERILSKTPYGLNFPTIGASGYNACVLHYEKNDSQLHTGELFLLDFGARWGCIGADVSRTFPVSGKFSYLQKILYEIVLQTQKEVEKMVSPKVTLAEINNFCWDFLNDLLEKEIIQNGGKITLPYKKSPHSVSHLIGQVVHEGSIHINYRNKKLQVGWLISNEPGVYGTFELKKDGILHKETLGIRLEDNLLITQEGNINLSKDIPKEIKDLESLLISQPLE